MTVTACGDEALVCPPLAEGARLVVVDHARWVLAEADEDPWVEFRPADITCDESGRQFEDFGGQLSYGIDTGLCGYTTVIQESLEPLCAGDMLYVWIWNFGLSGPEGSAAHLGVDIDGERVFEKTLPIPGPSGLVAQGFPVTVDHPRGAKVAFHVRNHGANSYQLLELGRCTGDCAP
jgi:hypothetical protein